MGAQPTITAHNLLVKHEVVKAAKMKVSMKKAVSSEEVVAAA